jgi:transitional endoplasmic reticulum ATPase
LADAPVKEKQVKLQVANARAEESGGGIARMPRATMAELGVTEGDVIAISGKRQTASRVMAPYAEDEGIEVVRLDGLQRANAGAGAGDMVVLSRVETRAATRVVFAPAQENLRLQGSANALKRSFFGRPLVAGDTVATACIQPGMTSTG